MTDLLETAAPPTRGLAPHPASVPGDLLQGVLDEVVVTADASRATVAGHDLEASGPREMKRLVAGALYEHLHAGLRTREAPPRLRDPDLEARLTAEVPVRALRVRLPLLSRPQALPGSATRHVLVALSGVRVWVPETGVQALPGGRDAEPGDHADVVVPAVRPAVSPGFLFVDRCPTAPAAVRRLYVNVTGPDHAPAVWGRVLAHLEETGTSFRAKVLSAKDLYPRRDAVVVYLSEVDAPAAARGLVAAVAGLDGVGPEVSRFAARIAPGVSTAAEPRDTRRGMQGLSFGEHRATVVATALVESAAAPHERPARVLAALAAAGIDPHDLSRNTSPTSSRESS